MCRLLLPPSVLRVNCISKRYCISCNYLHSIFVYIFNNEAVQPHLDWGGWGGAQTWRSDEQTGHAANTRLSSNTSKLKDWTEFLCTTEISIFLCFLIVCWHTNTNTWCWCWESVDVSIMCELPSVLQLHLHTVSKFYHKALVWNNTQCCRVFWAHCQEHSKMRLDILSSNYRVVI